MNNNRRKSLRLPGYDYSQDGWYYITLCLERRKCLFGSIIDGRMQLNVVGKMVDTYWNLLCQNYQNVYLDKYVIMPNHIHGIVILNNVGATLVVAQNNKKDISYSNISKAGTRPAPTIGEIVGRFKSITTNVYIQNVKEHNWQGFEKRLWQRNYYEHIVRDERDLNRIREYITSNPENWEKDELFS